MLRPSQDIRSCYKGSRPTGKPPGFSVKKLPLVFPRKIM